MRVSLMINTELIQQCAHWSYASKCLIKSFNETVPVRDTAQNVITLICSKTISTDWNKLFNPNYLLRALMFSSRYFSKTKSLISFLNGPTPPSFSFIFVFFKHTFQILQQIDMWKMSIQYTVPGFKLTTFGTWVSFHNH